LTALAAGGCGAEKKSVITVYGIGVVSAQPDMVQMNISLQKTSPSTKQAQEAVTVMVRQALQILKDAGIEDKNITTASLRFSPEYEWNSSRRILLGQKAEQIITFSITNINSDSEKVSQVIDSLIQINGIELNQMSFSVKDNAALFARSRELAYQKAFDKAAQYAQLSGLKIVKTLNISEAENPQVSPVSNRMFNQAMMSDTATAKAAAGSTALPAGEMEITSRILVEFLLK
jgi:uncharacterized protein YggE